MRLAYRAPGWLATVNPVVTEACEPQASNPGPGHCPPRWWPSGSQRYQEGFGAEGAGRFPLGYSGLPDTAPRPRSRWHLFWHFHEQRRRGATTVQSPLHPPLEPFGNPRRGSGPLVLRTSELSPLATLTRYNEPAPLILCRIDRKPFTAPAVFAGRAPYVWSPRGRRRRAALTKTARRRHAVPTSRLPRSKNVS